MTDGAARAQSFYSRWARLYDALAVGTPGIGSLRVAAVDALDPRPGDTVVEMGCGTGANLPHLRERVGPEGTVVGVDFAAGTLARARARVERAGWENVRVVRADATAPPLDEADAVFAAFVVGMLADPAAAVRDWCDLAGPGGRVGLLDLARTTRPAARALNPLFGAFVFASAPPGSRWRADAAPTRMLDRRVLAARRALRDACADVTHSTRALGFARVTAGRVG